MYISYTIHHTSFTIHHITYILTGFRLRSSGVLHRGCVWRTMGARLPARLGQVHLQWDRHDLWRVLEGRKEGAFTDYLMYWCGQYNVVCIENGYLAIYKLNSPLQHNSNRTELVRCICQISTPSRAPGETACWTAWYSIPLMSSLLGRTRSSKLPA